MFHRITFLSSMLLLLSGCVHDGLVEVPDFGSGQRPKTISFSASERNITRASMLQEYGFLNFGIFGYKSNDDTRPVIDNYLVGYNDSLRHCGYYMTLETQTTLGDYHEVVDGKSYWAYERLGSEEYIYNGTEDYIKATQTEMMSNHQRQALCRWDPEALTTSFYAYAPYVHGSGTATFNNLTRQLTIPGETLTDGYDQPVACGFMYAAATVVQDDYGKDVWLQFHRLNAKVNIKFYETIEGYSIRLIDLFPGKYDDIQATPSVLTDSVYTPGEYYSKAGLTIDFSASTANPVISQQSVTRADNTRPLVFKVPSDTIGITRETATASPTTYYAIPKDNDTGFTFHVSFELTSDLGETIIVKNATVFVPKDHCNWKGNHAYTYIFKITKNTTGSTDPGRDKTIDPTDPSVDPERALYPIIFDAAKVDDWSVSDTEHTIG